MLREGIYAILDGRPLKELIEIGELLLERSVPALQIRAKSLDTKDRTALAHQMKNYASKISSFTELVINDDVELAQSLSLSCHVGQGDQMPSQAKPRLAKHALLGLSTHTVRDVVHGDRDPFVDYMGFGPIYETRSKSNALSPRSLDDAKRALSSTHKPLVAIGGLHADNLGPLFEIGFRYFAFLSYFHSAKEIDERMTRVERCFRW